MPDRPLPSRLTGSQFGSIMSDPVKSGSSVRAERALRADRVTGRAMRSSEMSAGQARAAFKAGYQVLKKAGLLAAQSRSADETYSRSMSRAATKGVIVRQKTLHEIAVEERRQERKEREKKRERREENLQRYKDEVVAEQTGKKANENPDGVVRMVEHGVAAKAEQERTQHGVTATDTGQKTGLASGSQTKNNQSSSTKPTVLKDIMFD